jgi:hypothetical protein
MSRCEKKMMRPKCATEASFGWTRNVAPAPGTSGVTDFLTLQNPNALMDAAYDDQVYVDDRTLDSHVKRVRRKFKRADDSFNLIDTIYGVGYRFRAARKMAAFLDLT